MLADYGINRDYYEKMCENKDKPEMECHGKCQITKETKKESLEINFERFSFDFYAHSPTDFTEPQKSAFNESKSRINAKVVLMLPAVTIGVPNPPPNSGFN